MQHIARLLKTIELLSRPQGATMNQLVQAHGLSKRQIQRWILQVQEMGFPIYDTEENLGREKLWKMDDDYVMKLPNISLPKLELTSSEMMALLLLWGRADIFKHTRIHTDITLAFNKLFSTLDQSRVQQFRTIHDLFLGGDIHQKNYEGKDDIISSLIEALLSRQRCTILYYSFSKEKEQKLTISPLHLFQRDGGLYLFARINDYTNICTLALERINDLKVLDENYTPPRDFDPNQYLLSAFNLTFEDPLKVKILFSPDQAKFIKERRWAANQKTTTQSDGSILLSMETSGWIEVKRWILSFGGTAEVLEPPKMRDEIKDEVYRLKKIYS